MNTPHRASHHVAHDEVLHRTDPLIVNALERHREMIDAADSHRLRAMLPRRVRRPFRRFGRG